MLTEDSIAGPSKSGESGTIAIKMISWRTEWAAIDARIKGLLSGGNFFVQSLQGSRSDDHSVGRRILLPQSKAVYSLILKFKTRHESSLTDRAVAALVTFSRVWEEKLRDTDTEMDERLPQARLTALTVFAAEFEHCISDQSAAARRLVDRAFSHLQRSIIADPTFREKWTAAFGEGEVACERLGATHLLLHGIWAFKAHAAGERTDLVLGSPVKIDEAEKSAEAMVLTEWKKATPTTLADKLAEAQRQATLYGRGSLAGFELAEYRYLVIVSDDRLDMPPDQMLDSIIYRHINIAVSPRLPGA